MVRVLPLVSWTASAGIGIALLLAPRVIAQGVVMQRNLSLPMAKTIAEATLAECQSKGFHTSAVVVDRAGQVMVLLRDEAATAQTAEMARRKAYTARMFRTTTLEFQKRTSDPAYAAQREVADILALGGGVPIQVGTETIGGVGSSGSTQEMDDACAKGGVAKVATLLTEAGPPPRTAQPAPVEARAQSAQSVRLYVFDCGVLKRGEPTAYGLTRDQVGSTDFSDACYLVVHPRGTLLWDVGIIPDNQIGPSGVEVQAANGTNVATKTLRNQLKEIGYTPQDITYLAISHGHADHIANANDYASATLLIQRAEWDSIFSEGAQKQPVFATYSGLRNSKKTMLNGEHDVFGDGTVVLKSTPGHTPGHQSLFIRLARTGPVLLTGDLYHYAAERTLKKVPVRDNKEQTEASRAAIDELLKQTGAQLWIQHDILANAKLKHAPLYYD
jgi:N-acyl homoserine lactone hydrolase